MEIVQKCHVGTRDCPRVRLSLKCGCTVIVPRRSTNDEREYRCPNGCDPKRIIRRPPIKTRERIDPLFA
jgi:hypothetical protein